MKLVLTESMFTNNEYSVSYGNKKATFTIVDIDLSNAQYTTLVYNITCVIRIYDDAGALSDEVLGTMIAGMADDYVGVTANVDSVKGKILTKDNMSSCTVELYE